MSLLYYGRYYGKVFALTLLSTLSTIVVGSNRGKITNKFVTLLVAARNFVCVDFMALAMLLLYTTRCDWNLYQVAGKEKLEARHLVNLTPRFVLREREIKKIQYNDFPEWIYS